MSAGDKKVEINSDVWFQAAEQEQEVKSRIVKLSIDELHPFRDHPFKIRDDDEMNALAKSVQDIGIKMPILVRPRKSPEDGYEIISGHRRTQAAIDADMNSIPAIVEELDDDTATILMADSNLCLSTEKYSVWSRKYTAPSITEVN